VFLDLIPCFISEIWLSPRIFVTLFTVSIASVAMLTSNGLSGYAEDVELISQFHVESIFYLNNGLIFRILCSEFSPKSIKFNFNTFVLLFLVCSIVGQLTDGR
jgi:ABC-type transport system involved in multi-copper enzyme maturation permease subunit